MAQKDRTSSRRNQSCRSCFASFSGCLPFKTTNVRGALSLPSSNLGVVFRAFYLFPFSSRLNSLFHLECLPCEAAHLAPLTPLTAVQNKLPPMPPSHRSRAFPAATPQTKSQTHRHSIPLKSKKNYRLKVSGLSHLPSHKKRKQLLPYAVLSPRSMLAPPPVGR